MALAFPNANALEEMKGCPAPAAPIELEAIIESMRPRWYIVDQTLPSFGIWLPLPATSGVCVFQGFGADS